MIGWQCPGCGACYSPFVERCGNCQPRALPAISTAPYPSRYAPGTAEPLPPLPRNTC